MYNNVISFGETINEALIFCKLNEIYYNTKYKINKQRKRKELIIKNNRLQYKTSIFVIEKPNNISSKKLILYLHVMHNYKQIKKQRNFTNFEFKALNILLNYYGEDLLDTICKIMIDNKKEICIGFKINNNENKINSYNFMF